MKLHIVLTLGVIGLMAGGASAGLINYYSFNNQTLVDEANTYGQNVGANVTTATYTAVGTAPIAYVAGTGRSYDGNTGNYALYIKSGNGFSSEMTMPGGNADINLGSAFTVEMWVNPGGGYTSQTAVTFMSATNFGITKSGYGDPGTESVKIGASTTGVGSWPTTGWHHIAIVSDGTTGKFYFDGTATTIGPVGTLGANIAMAIGAASMSGTYPNGWDVYVDDVAMWNEALSAATITAHAQLTTGAGYGLTVPEPATLSVVALGGLGLWFRSRRKR